MTGAVWKATFPEGHGFALEVDVQTASSPAWSTPTARIRRARRPQWAKLELVVEWRAAAA